MKYINGNILIYKIASAYNIKTVSAGSSTNKQFPVKNVIIKISSVENQGGWQQQKQACLLST